MFILPERMPVINMYTLLRLLPIFLNAVDMRCTKITVMQSRTEPTKKHLVSIPGSYRNILGLCRENGER